MHDARPSLIIFAVLRSGFRDTPVDGRSAFSLFQNSIQSYDTYRKVYSIYIADSKTAISRICGTSQNLMSIHFFANNNRRPNSYSLIHNENNNTKTTTPSSKY